MEVSEVTDQVARRQDPRRDVVSWLKSPFIETEIKRALPDHIPIDWFMRCAQTALLNNTRLAEANKESLLRELVAVAQLGLVTDPQLGEAWLIIDRKGMVQRRVGYQGLRKLALQSGLINSLNAQAVYRNDRCAIALGDSPHVNHEIDIRNGDRGEIIGYYAVARIKDTSEPSVEWMSQKQVEAHRDRYSDAYGHPDPSKRGPWADPLAAVEMGRKTVFRRLAKWLPKSPVLADVLAHEDRQDMRDVTPGPGMLPAPEESADEMDRVVAMSRQTEDAPQSAQEPRQQARTQPAAPVAGEASSAASEARSASKGRPGGNPPIVDWRGKSYQRLGMARRAALGEVEDCKTLGDLLDLKEPVDGFCRALRSVGGADVADEIEAAFRAKRSSFAPPAPTPDPTRHDPETGEVEPEPGDGNEDDESDFADDGEASEEDEFVAWCEEMREDMRRRPIEALVAGKNAWIARGRQAFGERAELAVEEAYQARQRR
jgi:recombination protein RecT